MQLERNTTWWSTADRIPGAGERVRNISSRVLFQYVPGHGLQLHPLANWGRAASLFNNRYGGQGRAMVNELLAIAVDRGGRSDLGVLLRLHRRAAAVGQRARPGHGAAGAVVGLQQHARSALRRRRPPGAAPVRAAHAAGRARAHDAPAPTTPSTRSRPACGSSTASCRPSTACGTRGTRLGDGQAAALFKTGDAEARQALRFYDTGRWSRYSNRGVMSNVHYHLLLRDFLRDLCRRSASPPTAPRPPVSRTTCASTGARRAGARVV